MKSLELLNPITKKHIKTYLVWNTVLTMQGGREWEQKQVGRKLCDSNIEQQEHCLFSSQVFNHNSTKERLNRFQWVLLLNKHKREKQEHQIGKIPKSCRKSDDARRQYTCTAQKSLPAKHSLTRKGTGIWTEKSRTEMQTYSECQNEGGKGNCETHKQ